MGQESGASLKLSTIPFFVDQASGCFYAVDPETGQRTWIVDYETGEPMKGRQLIVDPSTGGICTTSLSGSGYVWLVDPTTGNVVSQESRQASQDMLQKTLQRTQEQAAQAVPQSFGFQQELESPLQPEQPLQPQLSLQPEQPLQPQLSLQPEQPLQYEQALQPEQPLQYEQALQPEQPLQSQLSFQPEQPLQPQLSLQPEQPLQPQLSLQYEQPPQSQLYQQDYPPAQDMQAQQQTFSQMSASPEQPIAPSAQPSAPAAPQSMLEAQPSAPAAPQSLLDVQPSAPAAPQGMPPAPQGAPAAPQGMPAAQQGVPAAPTGWSGMAIAGLVLGIVAIATSFLPVINIGSLFLALLGLVFAIVGIVGTGKKKLKKGRGMAVAGLVLCIVAIGVTLCTQFLFGKAVESAVDQIENSPTPAAESESESSGDEGSAEGTDDGESGVENGNSTMIVGQSETLDNGLTISVSVAEFGIAGEDGGMYSAVTVNYTNNGSSSISFSPVNWKAQDDQGNSKLMSVGYAGPDQLNSGELAPGGSVSGKVYFEGDISKVYYYASVLQSDSNVGWVLK